MDDDKGGYVCRVCGERMPAPGMHGGTFKTEDACEVESLRSKLSAALGRLGLQQEPDGGQSDEIDRLEMALELREQDVRSLTLRLSEQSSRLDSIRRAIDEASPGAEQWIVGQIETILAAGVGSQCNNWPCRLPPNHAGPCSAEREQTAGFIEKALGGENQMLKKMSE